MRGEQFLQNTIPGGNRIDVYTSTGYMLHIDCWEAEKNLTTTPAGSTKFYEEVA